MHGLQATSGKFVRFSSLDRYLQAMPIYQHLIYQKKDRCCHLTLNRPDHQNAISDIMIAELKDGLKAAQEDPTIKIIILKGSGDSFSIGTDPAYLAKRQGYTFAQQVADSAAFADLLLELYRSTRVIVAEIGGHAIGGGAGLIAACDFAFAASEVRIGFHEVSVGEIPAAPMLLLIRKLGETRAKELLLSGQLISASQAANYHLINEVVPQDRLSEHVETFADLLCNQNATASLQMTKKMIADVQSMPLPNAAQFLAKMDAYARGTEEAQRGLAGQLNGEKITW